MKYTEFYFKRSSTKFHPLPDKIVLARLVQIDRLPIIQYLGI